MCKYTCKTRCHLKRHLAQKHNINVKWFACNICKFKCNLRSNLKRHLAQVHDIDVKLFSCDICEFKCKERSILKQIANCSVILPKSTLSTLHGFLAPCASTNARNLTLSHDTMQANMRWSSVKRSRTTIAR